MLSLIEFSCVVQQGNVNEQHLVKVIAINSQIASIDYIITCVAASDTLYILSTNGRNENNCENKIKVGDSVNVELIKKNKVELDGLSYKLYVNDIYLDGNIIFPKRNIVYSSPSITGICLK